MFQWQMISDAEPQDLVSRLPSYCYPPHTAGWGSGWSNLLLPVCRCSDSQRALPWKLGHTDYMFWSVLMSVMQTENWKKSRGEKAGGASFSFSSGHHLCPRWQEERNTKQGSSDSAVLKDFYTITVQEGCWLGLEFFRYVFLVYNKHN